MERWMGIIASLAALTACGGSDDEERLGSNSASCAAGMMGLAGELEGQAVSVQVAWTSREWNQISTPKKLEIGYAGGSLHLEWNELVATGDSTAATGSLVMPASTPRAGETICGGAGTKVGAAESGSSYLFWLRDLSLGPTCPGTALGGSIDGCVADKQ